MLTSLSSLPRQVSKTPPPAAPALPSLDPPERPLPNPEFFSSELEKCGCMLVFRQQISTYASGGAKITIIMQLLQERALKLAHTVLKTNSDLSLRKFRSVFDKGSSPEMDKR